MNKKFTFFGSLALALLLTGCNGNGTGANSGLSLAEGANGDMVAYQNSNINAIQQALPTIMIIPSDNLLSQNGFLKTEKKNGREFMIRDYKGFLAAKSQNKNIISTIQNAFVKVNYPLQDLEQTLKQLDTQEATDMADGFEKDAKTRLLTTAQPDMILELDYSSRMNITGKMEQKCSYSLSVIDAYTNKVIATENESDMSGNDVETLITNGINAKMNFLQKDIQNAFSDILTRGREVTVRLTVANGTNVHMSDSSVEGDTYADWIIDYMKSHTIKGAYKLNRNTESELYFTGVRIALLNEDGTQYGVYDWSRDFCKNLRKNLGLKVTNKAQGLGEVLIVINGI